MSAEEGLTVPAGDGVDLHVRRRSGGGPAVPLASGLLERFLAPGIDEHGNKKNDDPLVQLGGQGWLRVVGVGETCYRGMRIVLLGFLLNGKVDPGLTVGHGSEMSFPPTLAPLKVLPGPVKTVDKGILSTGLRHIPQ